MALVLKKFIRAIALQELGHKIVATSEAYRNPQTLSAPVESLRCVMRRRQPTQSNKPRTKELLETALTLVGTTFQQFAASDGSDLGVIAELALNLLAAWRCTDLLKAKPSHQLAFSRTEYSL